MIKFPILRSQRCILSSIKERELEELHHIMLDDEVKRFLPEFYDIIKSKDDFNSVIKSFCILWKDKKAIIWGIYYKKRLVGFIGLLDIPTHTTIFYSTHKDFRLCGLMTEAITAVIDYILIHKLSPKVQSEVFQHNYASIRVLTKNGFTQFNKIGDKIQFHKLL